MRLHRFASVAVVLAACALIGRIIGQTTSKSTPRQKSCSEPHCNLLQINHVSATADGKAGVNYITAVGKSGTYILSLSCLTPDCQGEQYEYSEQESTADEPDGERYAYLDGPKVNHEYIQLEVIVPDLPVSDVRNLIGQCQVSSQFTNEADCGKWVSRKIALQNASCPDPQATKACNSFQELVRGNDPYIMEDLANQAHVYACFIPNEDRFFDVTFSEPLWINFSKPTREQVRDGVYDNALAARGGTEIAYYKNGIGDENASIHNIGNWFYIPFGDENDQKQRRLNGNSKRAQFKGKDIEIGGDRWTLTERYKNQSGTQTEHTVIVQLSTGRFQEDFSLVESGKQVGENSGRCLIAPRPF